MTEVMAQRFRLLGEPTRLRILQLLETGDKPVNDIVNTLNSSQPNISKHLQALCYGGLISRRRDGLNVVYSISDPMVFKLCELVCNSATEQTRTLLGNMENNVTRTAKTKGRSSLHGG
jgi:DNA-binding transcriptional ArsR family regulator